MFRNALLVSSLFLFAGQIYPQAKSSDEVAKAKVLKDIQANWEKFNKLYETDLKKIEAQIKSATSAKIDPKAPGTMLEGGTGKFTSFRSKEDKEQQIATLKERIKELTEKNAGQDLVSFASVMNKCEVGEVGLFREGKLRVITVSDSNSAIVEMLEFVEGWKTKGNRATPSTEVVKHKLFITGISTSAMADGQVGKFPGLFTIVGNKKVGEATILHAQPLELTEKELHAIKTPKR